MLQLEGKTALVTGASRGIGAAIASRFAEEGAAVAVNYRTQKESAEAVVRDIQNRGGKAGIFPADISDTHQLEKMIDDVVTWSGRLDILVNNAGIGEMKMLDQIDNSHWERVFKLNVLAPLIAVREAVKHFGEQGGVILNISSGAASAAPPGMSVYSASKAALEAITKSLAAELGSRNIRVNALSPGLIVTDMLMQNIPQDAQRSMIMSTPLGRLGVPDDIAEAALFMVSNSSRWITGAVLPVSGGLR